jgi:hypothetical protein
VHVGRSTSADAAVTRPLPYVSALTDGAQLVDTPASSCDVGDETLREPGRPSERSRKPTCRSCGIAVAAWASQRSIVAQSMRARSSEPRLCVQVSAGDAVGLSARVLVGANVSVARGEHRRLATSLAHVRLPCDRSVRRGQDVRSSKTGAFGPHLRSRCLRHRLTCSGSQPAVTAPSQTRCQRTQRWPRRGPQRRALRVCRFAVVFSGRSLRHSVLVSQAFTRSHNVADHRFCREGGERPASDDWRPQVGSRVGRQRWRARPLGTRHERRSAPCERRELHSTSPPGPRTRAAPRSAPSAASVDALEALDDGESHSEPSQRPSPAMTRRAEYPACTESAKPVRCSASNAVCQQFRGSQCLHLR